VSSLHCYVRGVLPGAINSAERIHKELVSNLKGSNEDPCGIKGLYLLAKLLSEPLAQGGITPFELYHGGLIQALLEYLTNENWEGNVTLIYMRFFLINYGALGPSSQSHRLKCFIYIYLQAPVTSGIAYKCPLPIEETLIQNSFRILIRKLQIALSRYETFKVQQLFEPGNKCMHSWLGRVSFQFRCTLFSSEVSFKADKDQACAR
jgi:hypothetical protein